MKSISLTKLKNYFYPISKRPPLSCYGVSDLFFWRKTPFTTRYELIDINSLISPSHTDKKQRKGLLYLLSPNGQLLSKHGFIYPYLSRKPLEISSFLDSNSPDFGTFALFNITDHGFYPATDSFRSDRGYTFYSYHGSDFSASLHGNLDAVALSSDHNIIPLSSILPFPNSLNLQYVFRPNVMYELCFTNPSASSVNINIRFISAVSNEPLFFQKIKIASLGSSLISLPCFDRQFFIQVSSRLVLPRPLIFSYSSSFLEVFHS